MFTKIATVKEQKTLKPTEPFWTTEPNSMLLWPNESQFLPQIDKNMTFASYSTVLSKPHRPLEENIKNSQLFGARFYQPVLLTALNNLQPKIFQDFSPLPCPHSVYSNIFYHHSLYLARLNKLRLLSLQVFTCTVHCRSCTHLS